VRFTSKCRYTELTHASSSPHRSVFGLRVAMFKAFGKDGWIDERLQFPEFKERKPTLPLGYLPVLSIDEEIFTQTEPMVRWAAKISGLYPTDLKEAMRVDEVCAVAHEVLYKCPFDADEEVKKAKRLEYAEGRMLQNMSYIDSKLAGSSNGFLLPGGISMADLQVYMVVHMIRTGNFDHIEPEYVDRFPNICKNAAALDADPLIVEYRAHYPNCRDALSLISTTDDTRCDYNVDERRRSSRRTATGHRRVASSCRSCFALFFPLCALARSRSMAIL